MEKLVNTLAHFFIVNEELFFKLMLQLEMAKLSSTFNLFVIINPIKKETCVDW